MRTSRVWIVIVALVAAGCFQIGVRSGRDRSADFSRLQTFAWLPIGEAAVGDQRVADRVVDARVRAEVDRVLREKGFTAAGPGAAPDFLLNYRVTTEAQVGEHVWDGADAQPMVATEPGMLYVAVLEPTTRRVLWYASTPARLLPHLSMQTQLERVDAAVEKLFRNFPPR